MIGFDLSLDFEHFVVPTEGSEAAGMGLARTGVDMKAKRVATVFKANFIMRIDGIDSSRFLFGAIEMTGNEMVF